MATKANTVGPQDDCPTPRTPHDRNSATSPPTTDLAYGPPWSAANGSPAVRLKSDTASEKAGKSADRTAERAAAAGAKVVVEAERGYGRAMLAGLAALAPTSVIVLFIDGDGSDRPDMMPAVLEPIESGRADFVLGSRLRGEREPGSLSPAQVVAGHLAGILIRLLYGVRFTDMSPFRAIRRDALERLLANLIGNSLRHTSQDGRITLAAQRERDSVVLSVEDTGEGIAPEHLPHLCDRFYRVDDARTRSAGGTGLGLAICKSIADAHGGSLAIESVVGEGTTVRVTLPHAAGAAAAAPGRERTRA